MKGISDNLWVKFINFSQSITMPWRNQLLVQQNILPFTALSSIIIISPQDSVALSSLKIPSSQFFLRHQHEPNCFTRRVYLYYKVAALPLKRLQFLGSSRMRNSVFLFLHPLNSTAIEMPFSGIFRLIFAPSADLFPRMNSFIAFR